MTRKPTRPSLRAVPAERREQLEALRLRSEAALAAASKAEAALEREHAKLAKLVAARQEAIDAAEAGVGVAYLDVVEAVGSRSRAAECLGLTAAQLRAAIALAPKPEADQ